MKLDLPEQLPRSYFRRSPGPLLNRFFPGWRFYRYHLWAFFALAIISVLFLKSTDPGQLSAREAEEAHNLGLPNWLGDDYSPFLSPDGRYLFFQSDRPGSTNGSNLWVTINRNYLNRLDPPGWTVPIPFRLPVDTDSSTTMKVLHSDSAERQAGGGFFTVNTDGLEGMFTIHYENGTPRELYFTSVASPRTGRDGFAGTNIYVSRYVMQRWSKPEHINEINSQFDDRMPALSRDGKSMYFVSNRPGGFGGYDLWYTERDDSGRWSRPVNAGEALNSAYNENSPFWSKAGNLLFFSSDRPGGFGHFDLYVSRSDGYIWSKPENLGAPFNSPRDDDSVALSDDGLWFYFASDRRDIAEKGGLDLYRTSLPAWLRESVDILFTGLVVDGRSRKPLGVEASIQIVYEKNTVVGTSTVFHKKPDESTTNFAIQLQSERIYKIQFSAPGFYPQELEVDYRGNIPAGRIDRRVIVMQPIAPKDEEGVGNLRMIPGRVFDEATRLSLPGSSIEYRYGKGKVHSAEVDKNGEFQVSVPRSSPFQILGKAPGYEPKTLNLKENSDITLIDVALKKRKGGPDCPGDALECIDNIRIFFDLNRSGIRASEKARLNTVFRILKQNPALSIEVQGHADRTYRGPKNKAQDYNMRLSTERARAVAGALTKMGIPGNRITVRAFGSLKPRYSSGSAATRALNRRVEFRRVRK